MASSRNLSGEGDFFFGASSDVSSLVAVYTALSAVDPYGSSSQPSLTSLSSNDSKAAPASKTRASMPSSPRKPHATLHMPPPPRPTGPTSTSASHKGRVSPLTPPPSPPFNARQAAAQIKGMDGYISFANIEGLGLPEGDDDESEEDAKSRNRWFQWLNSAKSAVASDRSRGRSQSGSNASR